MTLTNERAVPASLFGLAGGAGALVAAGIAGPVEVIARFDGYRGRDLFHCHDSSTRTWA